MLSTRKRTAELRSKSIHTSHKSLFAAGHGRMNQKEESQKSLQQRRNASPLATAPPLTPHSQSALLRAWITGRHPTHDFMLHVLEHNSPLGAYLSQTELHYLALACRVVHFHIGQKIHESPFSNFASATL